MKTAIVILASAVSTVSAFVPPQGSARVSTITNAFANGMVGSEGPEIKNFDPLNLSTVSNRLFYTREGMDMVELMLLHIFLTMRHVSIYLNYHVNLNKTEGFRVASMVS